MIWTLDTHVRYVPQRNNDWIRFSRAYKLQLHVGQTELTYALASLHGNKVCIWCKGTNHFTNFPDAYLSYSSIEDAKADIEKVFS